MPSKSAPRLPLGPRERKIVEVEADVSTPTVLRFLTGKPVQPTSARRITAAITKLGFQLPAPQQGPAPSPKV